VAKSIEVEAVKAAINKEWPEGTTADVVASAVISALDGVRKTSMRGLGAPLAVGNAFKPYWSSKTHYVAWIGPAGPLMANVAWVVTADSHYGTITYVEHPFWRFTSPVEEKARTVRRRTKGDDGEWVKGEDGKDLYEVHEYDTPGSKVVGVNDLGMVAGDRVTFRNDGQYTVEAVYCHGVLLRSRQSGLIWSEENGNLEKFYTDGWRN
jgi:hypothetical protein